MQHRTYQIALVAVFAIMIAAPDALAAFTTYEIAAMKHAGVTPPVITPKMISYSQLRYALSFATYFYRAALLIILMQSGFTTALSNFMARVPLKSFLRVLVSFSIFQAAYTLLRLPFNYYGGFWLPHEYGLSHESLAHWLGDTLKTEALVMVIGAFGFWLSFEIVDRFPRRWVVILWSIMVPLIAFAVFVEPFFVEPMFNRFTPMPPGEMRTAINSVATAAGIPNAPVFIVDKSRQTQTVNAYVTGIGSSARIVIWDNTLNQLPRDEVLAIVGHESGHYVLGHVMIGFALSCGGLLLGLMALAKYQERLIKILPSRWHIKKLTDLTAIPVILLLLTIVSFLTAPIENSISRWMEHDADAFGLQITANGPALARTFVSLSEKNLSDPDPPAFVKFWLFSHPTLRERIDFALGLNPEHEK